jgi:signal transduction histidine kinase
MPTEKFEFAVGIVVATIAFLLAGFFILVLVAYSNRRKRTYIAERHQLRVTFEQELLRTQLETQEETFSQIGRELHDNVGQLLSSTKLLLGVAERILPEVPEALLTAEETLGKAIQDIRSLSKSLDKEWLHQFNLIDNLRTETERINTGKSLGVALHSSSPALSLEPESQVILFRIIQEGIQNTLKHAQASEMTVGIEESGTVIRVNISDNGIGFQRAGAASGGVSVHRDKPAGMGLTNMTKRTHLLSGSIEWHSPEGRGTEVRIVIPTKT